MIHYQRKLQQASSLACITPVILKERKGRKRKKGGKEGGSKGAREGEGRKEEEKRKEKEKRKQVLLQTQLSINTKSSNQENTDSSGLFLSFSLPLIKWQQL